MEEDFIIRGGRIIDPANNVDMASGDVLVQNGRIAFVGRREDLDLARGGVGVVAGVKGEEGCKMKVIEAQGCLVTPGLVDCHVHAFHHATPLGIDIDACCLARGVTTVVDAGSAGCSTVAGLRAFIAERSRCRLLAFLHIVSHGLASAGCAGLQAGGELDSLNQVDVQSCVSAVRSHPDLVVGIKLRLSEDISQQGRNEQEAFRRALLASSEAGVPLMVHHANSTVPTLCTEGVLSCPGSLRRGDIFTHAFHWHRGNIVNGETGRVHPDVWEAKRRGVLFDVGHGFGSFGWAILERCAEEKFWPDVISTDLHVQSVGGPAYDLPSVMTKLMHMGMPLYDIVAATTANPARAIGKSAEIGSLKVGNEADISLLRLEACDVELEDSRGEVRRVTRRIVPARVFRAGKEHPITPLTPWPNPDSRVKCENNVLHFSKKPA